MEWWRPKAIERYKKLKSEGNLKPDILYYNKIAKEPNYKLKIYNNYYSSFIELKQFKNAEKLLNKIKTLFFSEDHDFGILEENMFRGLKHILV